MEPTKLEIAGIEELTREELIKTNGGAATGAGAAGGATGNHNFDGEEDGDF